jgi:hypothetical protein
MNTKEVYSLLEKYYDGRCSDEEEQILRMYFRDADVPYELEAEKEVFGYYNSALIVPQPSKGFEERIIRSLDKTDNRIRTKQSRKYMFALLSSAATLLLLFGSWFFFIRKTEPTDTFRDPALAYNETIKILYDVSLRLNTGMNALEPARKAQNTAVRSIGTVGRSTGMINDNLKALDYFQKAMDIVSSPFEIRTNNK